jgi:predicted DNA-binding transcriptional regulator YafY
MFNKEELAHIMAALRIMQDIDTENGHQEDAEFSAAIIRKIESYDPRTNATKAIDATLAKRTKESKSS